MQKFENLFLLYLSNKVSGRYPLRVNSKKSSGRGRCHCGCLLQRQITECSLRYKSIRQLCWDFPTSSTRAPFSWGSWGKPGELDRHAPILALALTSCPPQQIILAPPLVPEGLWPASVIIRLGVGVRVVGGPIKFNLKIKNCGPTKFCQSCILLSKGIQIK